MSSDRAELIRAHVEDDVAPGQRELIDSLLSEDSDARREAEEMRRLLQMVSALRPVEAPPDFCDQLNRRIRRIRRVDRGSLALLSIPFQVLSILLILAVATAYLLTEVERGTGVPEKDPTVRAEPHDEGIDPGL